MIGAGLRAVLGAAGGSSAPVITYAVWGSDVTRGTRSNGNLKVTSNTSNQTTGARSDIALSSGKWYFEMRFPVFSGQGSERQGVVLDATSTSSIASTASNVIGGGPQASANVWDRVAVDIDAGKVWVGSSSAWSGGGNPATGVSPTATFTAGSTVRIGGRSSYYYSIGSFELNAGASAFAYTVPSGFNSGWYSQS